MLHIRYQSHVGDAHGHGPFEAGNARVVAAEVLTRYATTLVSGGGIPTSILTAPGGALGGADRRAESAVGDRPAVRDRRAGGAVGRDHLGSRCS